MDVPSPPLGALVVERASVARILIDASLIRFDVQPTGIPRVVLNYIRHGRAFGQRNGIDLVLFELADDGRLRVRTLPGDEPEREAVSGRTATAPLPDLRTAAAKVALELLRYLTRIAVAVLGLLGAVLPIRAIVKATHAGSLQLTAFRSWARQVVDGGCCQRDERDVVYVEPQAGDVVLCPGYWHDIDPAIYETLRARGAQIVFVLHDIIPVTHPAYYAYPWRWKFEQRLSRSLDYVSHYYCVSRKTLLDLAEFAALHKKTIRASVAYNGFEPLAEQASTGVGATHAPLLGRRPWLMVGTLEPKKGYREALAAFEALWAAGYQRPLVVIGRRGWMSDDIVETFEASRWVGCRLFTLDALEDEELAIFYRRAHALLFASFAEGFGIPLIEAASHRLPILARDTPTPREILGSHGTFFRTADDLANGIKSLEDPVTYAWAQQKVSQINWFDWRSVVDSVMADILRRPQERRRDANLLDPSLLVPLCPSAERSAIVHVPQDDPSQIKEFLKLLEPRSVAKFEKIRVGGDHDGGYVMLEDFSGVSAALSLGIGTDVAWDVAIADRGIRVLQYDANVDDAPLQHRGCTFRRAKIVPVASTSPSEITIEAIVANLDSPSDLLLKLDIEGDEWSVLGALNQATLARFRQVVCEFHHLDHFGDTAWRSLARSAVEKLCRTHCVAHVHGNNYGQQVLVGAHLVPNVIEVTFVRRDAYEICASKAVFPTELDSPNDATAPDLFLGTFRFA
jgi:glycosyltransferase involved in cell wall biosynthesis